MLNLIKLKNISYSIDNIKVLKNINLFINEGELISVIGLNGSGKSQLSLLIAGLIDNYEGIYEYKDELVKSKDILGKKCGIVFQRPDNQFFSSIVKNDIAFGLENKNIPQNEMEFKIDNILEKFNIKYLKNKNINNLSGGEKQKVAIAAMLIMNFPIYIFDEITSMLDEKSTKQIFDIINKLHEENNTIIFTTHDMEQAKIANRVFIMKNGEIANIVEGKDLSNNLLKSFNLI